MFWFPLWRTRKAFDYSVQTMYGIHTYIHTCENGMAQKHSLPFKKAATTNNTKRNVFGLNHQKKVQGLQSENRTFLL